MIPTGLGLALAPLREEKYAAFQTKLIHTGYRIEGVRIPALRSLVKGASAKELDELAFSCVPETFEEVLLCGFAAGAFRDPERVKAGTDRLLPYFDNWAHVDCVTSSLAAIKKHRDFFLDAYTPLRTARGEFERRFLAVMLLDHYLDGRYFYAALDLYERIEDGPYYVDMALGWGLSVMMTKDFGAVTERLERGAFSARVTSIACVKATESRRLSAEQKALAREISAKRAKNG